jgi:hypothetical protein
MEVKSIIIYILYNIYRSAIIDSPSPGQEYYQTVSVVFFVFHFITDADDDDVMKKSVTVKFFSSIF